MDEKRLIKAQKETGMPIYVPKENELKYIIFRCSQCKIKLPSNKLKKQKSAKTGLFNFVCPECEGVMENIE